MTLAEVKTHPFFSNDGNNINFNETPSNNTIGIFLTLIYFSRRMPASKSIAPGNGRAYSKLNNQGKRKAFILQYIRCMDTEQY